MWHVWEMNWTINILTFISFQKTYKTTQYLSCYDSTTVLSYESPFD